MFRTKNIVIAAVLAGAAAIAQNPTADTSDIVSQLRAGRYSDAHTAVENALKASPQSAKLWALDGFALAHLGRDGEALASYQRALRLSPDYMPALEGAAQLEFAKYDQRAVPLLSKIVAAKPNDETSHAMLATLAYKRGDCATAVAEFQRSSNVISSKPISLEEYGSCLLQNKRAEEALTVFQRVATLRPDSDEAQYDLALAEIAAKQYSAAIAILKPLAAKNATDGEVLDVLAEAYEATSDTPDAVTALRQAIVQNPNKPEYYLHFADICMSHTSYQAGVDMLTAGIAHLPKSAALYLARGILYVQLGDYENSRKDFDRADQLDPHVQYGQGIQGLADLQRNDLAQAEADVRKRLNRAPQDAFLWYLLSETLVREGAVSGSASFKEAVSAAEKAVALRPNFPVARNLLARLDLERGDLRDAIAQSRTVLQQSPSEEVTASALYHLIQALRRSGDSSEVPALSKRLADTLKQAREQQTSGRRYALVEQSPAALDKR